MSPSKRFHKGSISDVAHGLLECLAHPSRRRAASVPARRRVESQPYHCLSLGRGSWPVARLAAARRCNEELRTNEPLSPTFHPLRGVLAR